MPPRLLWADALTTSAAARETAFSKVATVETKVNEYVSVPWLGRRPALLEPRLEDHIVSWNLAGQQGAHPQPRLTAELLVRHGRRRQRRGRVPGERDVVESCDRDILRHAD